MHLPYSKILRSFERHLLRVYTISKIFCKTSEFYCKVDANLDPVKFFKLQHFTETLNKSKDSLRAKKFVDRQKFRETVLGGSS